MESEDDDFSSSDGGGGGGGSSDSDGGDDDDECYGIGEDGKMGECHYCKDGGELLCCDGCEKARFALAIDDH